MNKPDENLNNKKEQDDLAEAAAENSSALNPLTGFNAGDFVKSLASTSLMAAKHPLQFTRHLLAYGEKMIDISQGKRSYSPSRKDRRFKDEAWEENPAYKQLMQSYLAMQESMNEWVEDSDFNELDERRANFLLTIVGDSISPTNNLLGNPTALKKAWNTKGKSLARGLSNYLDDLKNNGGLPSQVDKSKFEIGGNLATTPGSVVFKNDVLELIQYKPKTSKVFQKPLLIIPPQINKFYVFDLSPEKSFVTYCLSKSLQTFMISWRNPGPELKDWDISTYIESLVEALDAIKSITRQNHVNVMGACSGGITASLMMGYLEAKSDQTVNSLTTSVCVLAQHDDDSDMSIFTNRNRIENARKKSAKKGVLRGRELAKVFTWMRPNDLVWNYVVNNYLLGEKPPAFDVLYWNSDTTNLPAALHSDYLDIVADQQLERPGDTKIDGLAIDLASSSSDKYIVAGLTDHITPWKACYRSTQMLGGDLTFVLSSSGHIQSLINPPGNPRSALFLNDNLPTTADEWRAGSQEQAGTWWDHWSEWLIERSGQQKNAPRQLGNKKFPVGTPAPGHYIHQQAD